MNKQRGAILAIALIMLLVMTVLASAALYHVKIQARVTGSNSNEITAAQIANAILTNTLIQLSASPVKPTVSTLAACQNTPPCAIWPNQGLPSNLKTQALSWWTTYGQQPQFASGTKTPSVLTNPSNRYVIEQLNFVPDSLDPNDLAAGNGIQYYLIIAEGVAANGSSSVLQTITAQRF